MVKKKRERQFFKYKCSITGQDYVLTREAAQPDELISVEAYYQLNPDKDDRPLAIKKKLEMEAELNTPPETLPQ